MTARAGKRAANEAETCVKEYTGVINRDAHAHASLNIKTFVLEKTGISKFCKSKFRN